MTTTIGCKVNQYETQATAALLRQLGLTEVESPRRPSAGARADLVVINTCCVTASAAAKSRRAIRRAVRRHRHADVLILGCYATQHGAALGQIARQAGAAGNIHTAGHRDDVAERIRLAADSLLGREASNHTPSGRPTTVYAPKAEKRSKDFRKLRSGGDGRSTAKITLPAGAIRDEESMREGPSQHPAGPAAISACHYNSIKPRGGSNVKQNMGTAGLGPIDGFAGHQRAFVKVQDGCDAGCTYCIIPQLRSRVWSRPAGEILREVRALTAAGHKEVVLCGVFLGAYGRPTARRARWHGPAGLPDLLRRVAHTQGLWRVRLSSLEPGDVTDELLGVFVDCPAVAPHLHLSLQSGSERILRRMGRRYAPRQFLDAVRRARDCLDHPAITTDIIVGFPGETDDDFQATLAVARQARFSKIHVFGFSPRPGTPAWSWRDQAPAAPIIKERCRQLARLEAESAGAFRRQFLGLTLEAIVEQPNSKTPPGHCRGLTDRYIEVSFPPAGRDPRGLIGQVVPVRIDELAEGGLRGHLPGHPAQPGELARAVPGTIHSPAPDATHRRSP